MSLDTATELVNELQRLHMAYQRLVEENSSLKTSLSEMLSIKAENASLRIKLRSAQVVAYCSVLQWTVVCCGVVPETWMCYTILYYILLYDTILSYTILYNAIL